jgi:hypothetical protein
MEVRVWMHNHFTMAAILVLGESEPLTQDGLSVVCILNGVKHSECAEVKAKLLTESEYLNQCSEKCGENTVIKAALNFSNSTQDSCSYMKGGVFRMLSKILEDTQYGMVCNGSYTRVNISDVEVHQTRRSDSAHPK